MWEKVARNRELTCRVRDAVPRDARAIARVNVASWRFAYEGILPPSFLAQLSVRRDEGAWRRRLRGDPVGRVYVAEIERTVVGFCTTDVTTDASWGPWGAQIGFLYVHPAVLRQGIGTRLLRHALVSLTHEGFRWVQIDVLEQNARARRFYEHHGMEFAGKRWRDERFGAWIVRHERVLNPVLKAELLLKPSGSW